MSSVKPMFEAFPKRLFPVNTTNFLDDLDQPPSTRNPVSYHSNEARIWKQHWIWFHENRIVFLCSLSDKRYSVDFFLLFIIIILRTFRISQVQLGDHFILMPWGYHRYIFPVSIFGKGRCMPSGWYRISKEKSSWPTRGDLFSFFFLVLDPFFNTVSLYRSCIILILFWYNREKKTNLRRVRLQDSFQLG